MSKLLLGNQDRVEVGVAVARSEDGAVNATDLALELGIAQPRVRNQLLVLEKAGLLQRMPKSQDVKQWFMRLESPFWNVCVVLYEDWGG
ncbi:MAG: ArsR family transcriptional regulator [Solirubrobacterales bacterium]